jgi:arylsulfatase A-like enzyme
MFRRLFLLLAAIALVLPAAAFAQRQPNIVVIFCDDLGYGDLGVHWQNQRAKDGKPAILTPHIDMMAEQGVQMRHTYCPAPVCAPSRASLLLGVTQGHANVRDNQFDKALEDNHTIASVLGQAGYATAAFGKWGLQGKPGDDTPNKFEAHPMNRGFDYFFGYIRHRDGHRHYPKEDGKECYDADKNVADQLDKCYTTDLFAARAKKWIVDQVKQDKNKPFFVYLAHDTPHAILQNPTSPYPEGGGLNGGLQWTGQPGQMINTAEGKVDGWMDPVYAKTDWPEQFKIYANMVSRIDQTVGDINQLLEDLGIADNTLVIFTTDNGPSAESYLKGKPFSPPFFEGFGPFDGIKRDLWEGGIRTGMIAKWQGAIPAGRVSDEPSTFADFMATFCDAAGTPTPARSDGVSMLPAMTGKGEQTPANVYIEYLNGGKTPNYDAFEKAHAGRKRGQMQAIRLGDYIGVRYDIKSHADDFEIYKIAADPKQTKNLAKSKGTADLQQQMKDEVLRRRVVNNSAKRPYDDEPMPAVKGVKTKQGIMTNTPDRTVRYVAAYPDPPTHLAMPGLMPNSYESSKDGTMLFVGYLDAPKTGEYTFEFKNTNRSIVRLHQATIIDHDKGFDADRVFRVKVKLEAGLHPYRIYVNTDKGVRHHMSLMWIVPGGDEPKQIPEQALRVGHDGTVVGR